jgi:hypothetical protein
MKIIATILFSVFLISCQNSDSSKTNKFVPEMYEVSEMTHLMRSIYKENEVIKNEIISGLAPKYFPTYFLNIFKSKLTDNKPYTENFITYSKVYIDHVRSIYDSVSTISLKTRYNNSINSCISCHTLECTGPIPRIKKLLIE